MDIFYVGLVLLYFYFLVDQWMKAVNALLTGWFLSTYQVSKLSAAMSLYRAEYLTYFICQMWSTEEIWSDSQVRDSVSSIKIVLAHLCGNRLGRVCSWVQMTHLLTQAVKSDLSSISYPAEAGDHSIAVSPTREPNLDQSCSGLGVTEQIPELTLTWS